MKFEPRKVQHSINKAFLKEPVERKKFDTFKESLGNLLSGIEQSEEAEEREEHFKNLLPPFFKSIGFGDYKINTSSNIDLAIYTGSKTKDPLGVMMEIKRPSNKAEMISTDRLNRKAMHEAVLYYLEQRIDQENDDLKHVIITNMTHWYIFDAQEFERCFYRPSKLRKAYKEWKENRKVSSNTDFMYDKIASFISESDATISGISLPLKPVGKLLKGKEGSDYEKRLISLFKFFSPIHLLKEPFANDSNSLNKEFYRELLYILGLEETKEGSTRYIRRAEEKNRHSGSIIENAIRILDAEDHLSTLKNARSSYGADRDEQLFSVAMELGITWMNRILFLKLLEAQLYRYHRKDNRFKFLNFEIIDGLDELNKLFFQVLARKEKDRSDDVNEKFGHIPFLNSSLFDVSSLEHQTTRISGLDDHADMPVYSKSVLTDNRGETLNTLDYLFRFLEAYDFSVEGSEEIRDESKSLINASVLGLIFEKINGYKDGSFYTPGFITEYMARETLRKAVIDKFETHFYGPSPVSPSPPAPLPEGEGSDIVRGMSSEIPRAKLPESLLENARHLRKNQTPAEEMLWQLLRNKQLGTKFRRQHPVKEGFVLDFYTHEHKLGIELDGGYHDEENQKISDQERERILNDMNIRIIRFRNEEVLNNTKQVLEKIQTTILPSPSGRGTEGEGQKGPDLTITDIYNRIGRDISIEKANELINSITICDPAVGSGHFLVSCLNELIAIKSELGILADDEGKLLRGVSVEVENDELIITHGEMLYEYDVSHTWSGNQMKSRKVDPEKQRIQKTLFHEKRHLIENCLFGVDINPNSVKICRLRLWIELLKRAYYNLPSCESALTPSPLSPGERGWGEGGHLEVLPNIDINIKQGNSLVSRFELDADLGSVFKDSEHSLDDYKQAVRTYKQTGDRREKARLQELIDDIKDEYSTTLTNLRPINQKLSKARGRLEIMQSDDLFGEVKFTKKEIKKQEKKLKKLEEQKAEEESGAFYNQAFEWRFEFPEVLDDEGRFTGFDVVIGNPPYIRQEQLGELKPYLKSQFEVYKGTADLYVYFYELSHKLLRVNGIFSMITANKFIRTNYGAPLREYLSEKTYLLKLIDFGELPVFDEAATFPLIIVTRNMPIEKQHFEFYQIKEIKPGEFIDHLNEQRNILDDRAIAQDNWTLATPLELDIIEKVNNSGIGLEKFIGDEVKYGIKTGFNKAFIIDEETKKNLISIDPKSKEIIKPLLKGDDIRFYSTKSQRYFIILTKIGVEIDSFPAIKNYLSQYQNKLEKRYDKGNYWWELRPCDYYDEFEKEKIIYPDIAKESRFTLDQGGNYLLNTAYLIPTNDRSLLAILNSKLIYFYFKKISSALGDPDKGGRLRWIRQYVSKIPIAKFSKLESKIVEDLTNQILTTKKQNPEADTTKLGAEIDRLVYELYGLSEEEIGVVEGSNN